MIWKIQRPVLPKDAAWLAYTSDRGNTTIIKAPSDALREMMGDRWKIYVEAKHPNAPIKRMEEQTW